MLKSYAEKGQANTNVYYLTILTEKRVTFITRMRKLYAKLVIMSALEK